MHATEPTPWTGFSLLLTELLGTALTAMLTLGVAAPVVVMLVKATRSELRRRRAHRAEPPEARVGAHRKPVGHGPPGRHHTG